MNTTHANRTALVVRTRRAPSVTDAWAHVGQILPPARPGGSHIGLLIGPEGGLASEEVEGARTRGWAIVGLGPRILRTETAGPAIIAVLQARYGDLGVAG